MGLEDWKLRTAADVELALPDNWDEVVLTEFKDRERWRPEMGPEGVRAAIIFKTDLEKEPGTDLLIDLESETFQPPIIGENSSEGLEVQPDLNQIRLRIDYYRFFEAFTKKASERSFLKAANSAGGRCSRRMARQRDTSLSLKLITPGTWLRNDGVTIAPTPRVLYGGGVASVAALTNAGQMDASEIKRTRVFLQKTCDAIPIETANPSGHYAEYFRFILDEVSASHLQDDPVWQNAVANGLPRGWDNPQFTGAIGYYSGMLVYTWDGQVRSCHQGSPWRPETSLGTGVSIGDGVIDVATFEAKKRKNYLENFPTTGKIMIVSTHVGGTDEEIEYDNSGATADEITNRFDLVGVLTADHAAGSYIVLENYHTRCLAHGAEIAVRGHGKPDEKVGDVADSGMRIKVGIEGVYGESVVIGSDGEIHNYCLWKGYARD